MQRKTVTINIKIDVRVKEEAQFIVEQMGLSLSGVLCASLKQLIRTRKLYVSAGDEITPHLRGLIANARRDMDKYRIDPMTLEEVFD